VSSQTHGKEIIFANMSYLLAFFHVEEIEAREKAAKFQSRTRSKDRISKQILTAPVHELHSPKRFCLIPTGCPTPVEMRVELSSSRSGRPWDGSAQVPMPNSSISIDTTTNVYGRRSAA
jgi:hypothetical protein